MIDYYSGINFIGSPELPPEPEETPPDPLDEGESLEDGGGA